MEKMCITMCHLLVVGVLFGMVSGSVTTKELSKDPKDVAKWVENTRFAKQKVTHIHYYFHDTVSGDHPTALPIAQASISNTSPTGFGRLYMADDPVTVDPSVNSTIVGYCRGLYGSASHTGYGLVMALNVVFTGGKYKGSTLTLVGDNLAATTPREMIISGGTGLFRLARGVATGTTYFLNVTTGDAIVEYNLAVLHY